MKLRHFIFLFLLAYSPAQHVQVVVAGTGVPPAAGGPAPTLVSYTSTTNWTSAGTGTDPYNKTLTTTFTTGDIIVLIAGSEGSGVGQTFTTPTATGLSFATPILNHASASDPAVMLVTATVTSPGTGVTVTEGVTGSNGGGAHFGFGVWVWRSSTGIGNNATYSPATPGSTRVVSITPAGGAHSAIMWALLDWAANSTVQPITPTSTSITAAAGVNLPMSTHDGSNYNIYVATLSDQAGTGAVSYGIGSSAPAGTGPFVIVAVEIKHQ